MSAKLFKRILSLLLAVVLLFCLTSCFYYEEIIVENGGEGSSTTVEDEESSIVVGDPSDPVDDESSTQQSTTDKGSSTTSSADKSEASSKKPSSGTTTSQPNNTTPNPSGDVTGDLRLVINGEPNATIVIAKDYTDEAYNAAVDLQDYIKRITGATLPIGFDNKDRTEGNFILVGPSKYTKQLGVTQPTGYPEAEKVIMKRVKNYLILMGNDDGPYICTQYAVTMFLESLGCGWFGPDELWQVVPSAKNISIGKLDKTHTPKFTSRLNNVLSGYRAVGERWYLGGDQMMQGHGLPALVPKTTISTHPEWFSLIGGKRQADAFYWQYCYTNKSLAQEVGRKVVEYFDANPYAVAYPTIANDGWDNDWCECSECSKYSKTEQLIIFINNVADVVKKKYPDRRVQILSYHATLLAPGSNISLRDNVELTFCTETSITRPLTTSYYKPGYDSTSHNTFTMSWKDNVELYVKRTNAKNISFWKWYCIAAERAVWKDIPWVQGNTAIEDQNYFKSLGANYVFYDQGPLTGYREGGISFPLRWPLWYVGAKGMWDASLTGDDILSDACNKLFGKTAGPAMLKYYQALAAASDACTGYSILWVPPAASEMYTTEQIAKIDATVKAAEKLKGKMTADEVARMEATFALWTKAKALI